MSRPVGSVMLDREKILAHLPDVLPRWAGYQFPPERAAVVRKLMDIEPVNTAPAPSLRAA